jgi:hypothetical protein
MMLAYVQAAAPAVTVPVLTAFHAAGKNPPQPAPFETPALKPIPIAPLTVLLAAFVRGFSTTQSACFQVFTQLGQWKMSYAMPLSLLGATTGSRKDVLLAQVVEDIVVVELNSALHRT